ncbi:MAG: hypothetical protein WBB28_01860 [Crinalium sp.]
MEIIRRRKRVEEVYYSLDYQYKNEPGRGLSFRCNSTGELLDENGELVTPEQKPFWFERLKQCRKGIVDGQEVIPEGILTHNYSFVEPPVGRCECGEEVELAHFTNTCDKCGADYNSSGDRLAPREYWGEETGGALD